MARRVRFNRFDGSDFAALRDGLDPDVMMDHRDSFGRWDIIGKERTDTGQRTLLSNSQGGLAWVVQPDSGEPAHAVIIGDDEAREVWPRLRLQFSDDERHAIAQAFTPGAEVSDALKQAFGLRRGLRSVCVRRSDATEYWLVRCGGLLAIELESHRIVSCAPITGDEAWAIVQPVVDPA